MLTIHDLIKVPAPKRKSKRRRKISVEAGVRTFRGACSRRVGSVDELVDFERFFAARLSELFDLPDVRQ